MIKHPLGWPDPNGPEASGHEEHNESEPVSQIVKHHSSSMREHRLSNSLAIHWWMAFEYA
jgi:hypothetical protein